MDSAVEETPFLDPRSTLEVGQEDAVSSPTKVLSRPIRRRCIVWIIAVIVVLLILVAAFSAGFAVGHFTATHSTPSQSLTTPPTTGPTAATTTIADEICANPPVLLISLDGFWNEYFERNVTHFISSLGSEGVKAEYMRSAYPTKTFPNHFTIVTGVYPESHGIVNNYFYDKALDDTFSIGNNDPKWWRGEPVWITAAKQGLKSGTYFWPGSEVPIQGMYPTHYFEYDGSVPYEDRVNTVLDWLDLPTGRRPQFMTLYFNEPDHSGHEGGPDSALVDAALGRVDVIMEDLFLGLKERSISDCVNVMIVSDHGMASYDSNKLFRIDPHVPEGYGVTYPSRGVNMDINVNGGNAHEQAVEAVYDAIQNITNGPFQAFYLRDVPLRLHIGHYNTERYGDIHLVGDVGSYITNSGSSSPPSGEHGYDNNDVNMQAIFIAHGPAFKEGYLAPGFDNIQIYNLVCALLNITPSANNGTFGALYHMLKPEVVKQLPPVAIREGTPGVLDECHPPGSNPGQCDDCVCPSHCQSGPNGAVVNLTSYEALQFQEFHLPWGVPKGGEGSGACILTNKESVTLYSNTLSIPLWVAYTVTKESIQRDSGEQCFQKDPRTPSRNCSNYETTASDYALISLAPGNDETTPSLLTTVTPQLLQFSSTVWSQWDQLVRQWTTTYGTIHIIVGSVLDSNSDGIRDRDEDYDRWLNGNGTVAVPSHFFGIVIRCSVASSDSTCPASSLDILGVLLPHQSEFPTTIDAFEFIQFRLSTLQDIEGVTGINFFPGLSAEDQARVKLHITPSLWA